MHIKGSWRPLNRSDESDNANLPDFELQYSNSVTILENRNFKIIYEGVIFDFDNTELLIDPRILDQAFGYYSYVLIDKYKGEICVGTDQLGYSPLYYAREDGNFLFSTSPTLLKYELKSASANMEAWDEILSIGDIIGTKTVVNEISRARWGQKFLLTADTVHTIDIWSPETPQFVNKERYIRKNNELLAEAMSLTKTCTRRKFIFLSGGHDSRRLAITANHINLSVTCATQATIGKNGADEDTLIAENVARCLGQPIVSHPLPSNANYHNDTLIKDFWIAFESHYHEWALPLLRHIPNGSLIYDGIIGDVTINGHYFVHNPSAAGNYWDLDHMSRLICGNRKSLIDPRHVGTPLLERVRGELALYPNSPHRLTYFFLLNHTRRNIGSWCFLFKLHGHLPCMPYIYRPLFLQSLSLDPKHYLDNWMQVECMKQMHATAASFPSTREKLPETYLRYYRSEEEAQTKFAMRNIRIRQDAKAFFPSLKLHLSAFKNFSRLGAWRYARSSMWAANTVSRFSNCLDWLEDRSGPNFPVTKETVGFLKNKFIR